MDSTNHVRTEVGGASGATGCCWTYKDWRGEELLDSRRDEELEFWTNKVLPYAQSGLNWSIVTYYSCMICLLKQTPRIDHNVAAGGSSVKTKG